MGEKLRCKLCGETVVPDAVWDGGTRHWMYHREDAIDAILKAFREFEQNPGVDVLRNLGELLTAAGKLNDISKVIGTLKRSDRWEVVKGE